MKKRLLSLALAGALSVSLALPAFAADTDKAKTYPVISESGTQYVPLRAVAEDMGFQVEWDQATQTATLSNDVYSVQVQPMKGESNASYAEGVVSAPMLVKDWRTYVDAGFFKDYLDTVITIEGGTATAAADANAAKRKLYRSSDLVVKEQYDYTYESVMVDGGDGYKLMTHIYKPVGEGPWPVVMMRTPYGKTTSDSILTGQEYAKRGIAYVQQYCRGKGGSEGTYSPNTYEKVDGTALMNWICEQDWCESLGIQGMSYMAYCAWCLADDLNPKVKCMYVEEYGVDRHVSLYKDGLFRQDIMTGWAIDNAEEDITKPEKNPASPYFENYLYMPQVKMDVDMLGAELSWYRDWITNTNYNDDYWNEGYWAQLKNVPAQVNVPVTVVAGLYDHHLEGTLLGYERLNNETKANSRLLLGPWNHGYGITPSHIDTSNAGDINVTRDTFNWFYSILVDNIVPEGEVQVYFIEEDKWVELENWPIVADGSETYYLTTKSSLANEKALVLSTENQEKKDAVEYVYDPENPVISTGGETLFTWSAMRGSRPQPEIGYREDVISFITEPLTEDLPIAGKISAKLNVSTDVDDTCFTYTVSEVSPDGSTYNIRSGITTLAYRNNPLGDRQTYTPGEIVEITIETLPITWNVKAGNSIRVDISSSNFPEYSVHSNYAGVWAEQAETRTANQTIYVGGDLTSSITFPTLSTLSN